MTTTPRLTLFALGLYVFLVYFYLLARFNGSFIEADTSAQTSIIFEAQRADSILYSGRPYSNGLSYTAVSLFIIDMTGLTIQQLQVIVWPLLTVFLTVVLFVTYRALTGSTNIALLASLFIFLQPDFLFVTWRGSHERITWLFTLLLLFCIFRSFAHLRTLSGVARFIIMFYLFAMALVATNTLFASSFMVGLIVSFAAGYVFLQVRGLLNRSTDADLKKQLLRLLYAAVVVAILIYIFIFYVYPPARNSLQELVGAANKVAVLTLNTEPATQETFNPYAAFISFQLQVYLVLTIFSWSILAVAGLGWLKNGLGFLNRKRLTSDALPKIVFWLTFTAYGVQLAGAIFADRSGALTGNLQVRLFTPFNLLVMPLAAATIWELFQRLKGKLLRRVFFALGMAAVGWFSAASVLKTSIDPLVGYKWIFNTEPEKIAENWIIAHVPDGSSIWAGFDERMTQGANFNNLDINSRDILFFYSNSPDPISTYYLFSTIEEMRWIQLGRPLLNLDAEDRIYDNGTGIVYRRYPRTPYQ